MAVLKRTRVLLKATRVPTRSHWRASHDETQIPDGRTKSSKTLKSAVMRIQYRYPSASARGQNSENCWMICGNLAPSDFPLFSNLFSNKDLELSRSGMLLANCVAPALVRLYWCPKPREPKTFGEEN
jgi:hypothetical protein